MRVDIYTKASCGYCLQAKKLLQQKNIPYTEHTIGTQVTKEDIEAKIKGLGLNVSVRTVPQIFYTDKSNTVHYIGGYSELLKSQHILGT